MNKVLTPAAQAERDNFDAAYGDCSCHLSPPCGSCTHPGNPMNQDEDEGCWMDDAQDTTTVHQISSPEIPENWDQHRPAETASSDEARRLAFNRIMGDPAMPHDQCQDPDYDEWLFNKAWDSAIAASGVSEPSVQLSLEHAKAVFDALNIGLDAASLVAAEWVDKRVDDDTAKVNAALTLVGQLIEDAASGVSAQAGACQQVIAGKAIDWSTDAPGCLGDPGMPAEDDIDQAFCHFIETAKLSEDEAVIACEWFSVGAIEFAARARAARVKEAR